MAKTYAQTLVVWMVLFVFTLTACGGGAAGSAPAENEPSTKAADVSAEEKEDFAAAESETLAPEDQKKADEMAKALSLIESIPDSVVEQGEDAVAKWLKEHQPEVSATGWTSCVAGVGQFVIENFTFLKILKIRKVLKAVGGAGKFAAITFKLYRKYRKKGLGSKAAIEKAVHVAAHRHGKEATALLLAIFGVPDVIDKCKDIFT